ECPRGNGARGKSSIVATSLGPFAPSTERGRDSEGPGRAELRRDRGNPEGSGGYRKVENKPRPGGAGKKSSKTENALTGIFSLSKTLDSFNQGDSFEGW